MILEIPGYLLRYFYTFGTSCAAVIIININTLSLSKHGLSKRTTQQLEGGELLENSFIILRPEIVKPYLYINSGV